MVAATAFSGNRLTSLQACRDITDQISPNVQRSVFVEGTAPDALYSRRQGNGNEGQCLSIQRSVKAELASFYPSRDRCLAQRVREQCSSPLVRSLWLESRRIPMLEFCMTLSAFSLNGAPPSTLLSATNCPRLQKRRVERRFHLCIRPALHIPHVSEFQMLNLNLVGSVSCLLKSALFSFRVK